MNGSIKLLVALGVTLSAGCSTDRPTTVPVEGKITFNGGPPPSEGQIYFAPLATQSGLPRRPASGRFDSDGMYQATSFAEGDGLIPGTYQVRIECWKQVPTMESPGVSYVPESFQPEALVVPADGGAVNFDLDVPLAND